MSDEVLTRQEVRRRQLAIAERRRKLGPQLTPVEPKEWGEAYHGSTQPVIGVWQSRDFLVAAFLEKPGRIRLSVNRMLLRDDGQWADGITWDDLQRLKREAGFGDFDAVEVFPADRDLVNVANMRHLYVFQTPLDFIWRAHQVRKIDDAPAPEGAAAP